MDVQSAERINTVIIGAGQAGLATGYHLAQRNVPFVILDANRRVGDNWRARWDSLRLFTPAFLDGLAGLRFPSSNFYFPTKDEMGDYLEHYSEHFQLPVRLQTPVTRVNRISAGYRIETTTGAIEADNVVVAMATFQKPKIPEFDEQLSTDVRQLHSSAYKRPEQLKRGRVLIVGAGNSGAEIGLELARAGYRVTLAGRDVGEIPFNIQGTASRLLLSRLFLRGVFHRVLTVDTPIGRHVRPKVLAHGGPLIRTKRKTLQSAGVQRAPRVEGVASGLPILANGQPIETENIVWCTGFEPGMSCIDLPIFDEQGQPRHSKGIVENATGLYFVGLNFLYALSSTMIHGVSRDAERIATHIAGRMARPA